MKVFIVNDVTLEGAGVFTAASAIASEVVNDPEVNDVVIPAKSLAHFLVKRSAGTSTIETTSSPVFRLRVNQSPMLSVSMLKGASRTPFTEG